MARKAAAKTETTEKAAVEVKDTNWLAGVIADKTGKEYTTYQLRILLRKLTKDGVIERGEGRYTFKGVNDPTVKAIVKAVKDGALEAETKEKTATAKKQAAAKRTAAKAPASASRKRKPKAEPEPEPELDDLDDIDEI